MDTSAHGKRLGTIIRLQSDIQGFVTEFKR
jgi:hypothetical protein